MDKGRQHVVVLGASPKRDRYSNQAVRLLREHGHRVTPVHPAVDSIAGLAVRHSLREVPGPVDTLTVYVSAAVSSGLEPDLLRMNPGRVVFNPGAENPPLRASLERHGIRALEACTLVLLKTGQF